jgi:hypothetical protein
MHQLRPRIRRAWTRHGGLYAGMTVLDTQAKAEYKCRLNELRRDLTKPSDSRSSASVPGSERDAHDYRPPCLRGGAGGDRKISSEAERARSAVTKCIKKTVQKSARQSHRWVTTSPLGSKLDTSAPIIHTRSPSCLGSSAWNLTFLQLFEL